MLTTKIKNPAEALGVFHKDTKCNGVFTIKSNATNKEFTYKIERFKSKSLNKYLTKVSVETGYMNWHMLGYYGDGNITLKYQKNEATTAKAIVYVLNRVSKGLPLDEVSVYHMGSCLKCGKPLTDSVSIERGLGPVCAR
jgi:hypothetical protein